MSCPISFPALTSVAVFVFFPMSAIITPVSHQSPSSLQHNFTLLSSLPHRSVPAVPLFPNRHRKTSPRLLLASRKCHHRMSGCSVPFLPLWPAHITSFSTEPNCSQLIALLTTSSFQTLFLFFSLFCDCLKATLRAAAAPLSLSVVPMIPFWLLFLFTSTSFPQLLYSVPEHWIDLWMAEIRSFPQITPVQKRKPSPVSIPSSFASLLQPW